MDDLLWIVIGVPVFILAGSVHEYMHAWTAYKLGDYTAKMSGRMTLNPLAHVELYGLLLMVFAHFGWMKPVPVNERNFKNPVRDMALVAIAGPVSNVVMAWVAILVLRLVMTNMDPVATATIGSTTPFIVVTLSTFIWVNGALAVFNMLPIPPLDGYRITRALIPSGLVHYWEKLEDYSWLILLLLFLPFSPLAGITGSLVISGVDILLTFLSF